MLLYVVIYVWFVLLFKVFILCVFLFLYYMLSFGGFFLILGWISDYDFCKEVFEMLCWRLKVRMNM